MNQSPNNLEARTAHDLLARNPACRLIDVREYPEWQAERLARATLMSLSTLNPAQLEADHNTPVLVLCRTGNRARQAAERLRASGFREVSVIEGGLEAWKKAGLPFERGASRVWSLERQVRFTAGALVLTGVLGWLLVSPWFLLLSAGIGSGLMFSAATDTCAMGMLLARMPWNRAPKPTLTPALEQGR
jgi:rhodanese-related sulfurtransferase